MSEELTPVEDLIPSTAQQIQLLNGVLNLLLGLDGEGE